jgi:hypothetical protein
MTHVADQLLKICHFTRYTDDWSNGNNLEQNLVKFRKNNNESR